MKVTFQLESKGEVMGKDKVKVQVRCKICRRKTPSAGNMETLKTSMKKQGWFIDKDDSFTCPSCS